PDGAGIAGCSVRTERDAPGQFANLNRFDHLLGRHVDHRYVVRNAIGAQQVFFFRREAAMPDPLADQQIFQNRVSDAVDHRDTVRRPEIDEAEFAIPGDIDADRLDRLGAKARDFELDDLL